jgi:hypothetical protein
MALPVWQHSDMTNSLEHFSFIKITITTWSVALLQIVHSNFRIDLYTMQNTAARDSKTEFLLEMS